MVRWNRSGVTEVAVVGVGPWGLAILERLIAVAGRRRAPVVLHVIEPGVPGAGNFSVDDPDYLPLNTPCGQHVMHPATVESDMPAYAQSLFAWARRRGYRWVGDECRITTEGRELSPNDFLPRRLMGEWLNWSYHALVAVCPGQVSVRHHATSAVDIEAVDGRELVHLADGRTLLVDQVILTTGHTPDHPRQGDESRPLSPYPVDNFRELIGPDDTVAIAGLGLGRPRRRCCAHCRSGRDVSRVRWPTPLPAQWQGAEALSILAKRSALFRQADWRQRSHRGVCAGHLHPGRGRPPAHLGGRKEREGSGRLLPRLSCPL